MDLLFKDLYSKDLPSKEWAEIKLDSEMIIEANFILDQALIP